ncbi:MAG: CHASE3 domain-containing protein, partial [Methylobacteriaceae bacterium]
MRAIANLSIIAKLVVVFALVILAVCGSTFVSWRSLGTIEETNRWRDHTYQVLLDLDRLTASMVDRETGLRGYLVSADPAFLEPFHAGTQHYAEALGRLRRLVSDNAEQLRRLDALDTAAGQWSRDVAEREIALMRDEATREQARRIEASGAGKSAMDTVRKVAGTIADTERGLLETRTRIA